MEFVYVFTQDAADVYGEVQEDEEDEENEGEEANIDATLHANVSLRVQHLLFLVQHLLFLVYPFESA